MDPRIRPLVDKVWRYHQLNHPLAKSDVIVVLCSHDTVVAERGAQLFLEGWAPLLVFSGGLGAITRHLWHDPEAERFARIAVQMGVPADRILIENRSTNTGENVQFTRRLLAERGIDPESLILVQKPYASWSATCSGSASILPAGSRPRRRFPTTCGTRTSSSFARVTTVI